MPLRRATLIILVLALAGCVAIPQPTRKESSPEALALLEAAAQAHGKTGFERLRNINATLEGQWSELASRMEPVLTDQRFRGRTEDRILLDPPIMSQLHRGAAGRKLVHRGRDATRVWYNDQPGNEGDSAPAALRADAHRLFLLGPLQLQQMTGIFELAGVDVVDGRTCDLLLATLRPGIGHSAEDRLLLYVDRETRLMRRLRFTLGGLPANRGEVVEVDVADYVLHAGVQWPTRFFERLRAPIPMLPVHRWQLVGLDVNRELEPVDIAGPVLGGVAAIPARPLGQ